MAELGLLRDHQGDEEPALRCRAPPEGRGEPAGASGWVGDPGGPREGPPGCDSGGFARQGAHVAGFPGGGGSARHHGCGGHQLPPPGPAHRPHPLALPPAEPTAAAAPAPTQAATQVTAAPRRPRRWAGGAGEGPVTRDTPPAGPGPPTQRAAPTPPPYGTAEGRAPPPVGERAGATSAGVAPLPRSPLTANH